jgi:hypothetical protein
MTSPLTRHLLTGIALVVVAAAALAVLADQGVIAPTARPPATQPTTRPSADEVMKELLGQRKENPLIEPSRRPPIDQVAPGGTPATSNLVGVAPGIEAPQARREGQFVVSRRGRMVRIPDRAQFIFTFEGDGEQSPEAPMILVPCQMLQAMEDLLQERGDKTVLVVSGQIFLYRGVNYLLPTLAKPDIDKGNLKH